MALFMYPYVFIEKTEEVLYSYYIETEGYIVASATDKQKDSLKEYMKKIKDIKLRVPEEYH